ncbi:major facilitator superfamily transporter [Thozetella sp. PMI_491]|nr:major facilitator superfamily transporter [Thozetella sp. PMI_491]
MTDSITEAIRVPGTIQLIDADGHLKGKHAATSDIVLIPAPSEDPEDPLNWPLRRKLLSTSCVVMYTLMVVLPSTAVYSVTTPISKATSLSVKDLITGLGIMFLFAGWGCIPWQAIALQYGKRPVYLISLVANMVIMGCAPLCTTWPTYLANKILHGFFTAPVESLPEISITDVWFAHERPRYLSFYGFALAFAGKLAPTLAGFINYGQSWEWTLYWCAIWLGIAFVYCFFLMEETNYDRHVRHTGTISLVPAAGDPSTESDGKEKGPSTSAGKTDVEIGHSYRKKTYWQKLSVWPESRPNRLIPLMLGPIRFFQYPVVVYAGLMYGANGLVWSSILNATAGTLYPSVYGFSTAGIAAAYLSGAVGVVVGALYCGKLGELLVLRLARKNGGYSEPEHILWTFMASLILVPFSLLLWGLGATYKVHWFGLVFSQFTLSISNAIACPMALAYAISCYPEMSGELVTTAVIIRNTMSFAINYGITPWINAMGLRNCFIAAAAIGLVWNASMFPMIWYGKKIRQASAQKYWAAAERAKEQGYGH